MDYILTNRNFSFFLAEDISFFFVNSFFFILVGFIIFLVSIESLNSLVETVWEDLQERIIDFESLSSENFFDLGFDGNSSEKGFGQVALKVNTTFQDVAGNEEAKEELKEVVKFLKDPKSFSKLGADTPKGVLLAGPPGTGKTLFARAVAGEAGRPFIRVSGSQFVELLVGIGAARVRELFDQAREQKPCIIFIDEIDSIARARSENANMGGGVNDEREQTLNQLLTEMDGFESDTGIVVMAATNRIDIIDPALIRPGRFDRQITINLPTVKDREAILKVHARGKRFDKSVTAPEIAQLTTGFSGADLANLLNEAAILAVRRKKKAITIFEILTTIDRILLGLEGKSSSRVRARQNIAFQEVSYAIMANVLNPPNNLQKLTIIPRAASQGNMNLNPSAVQYPSRETFINQIVMGLSRRAVEEIVQGPSECTVGSQQDIVQLTRALRGMIVRFAMAKLQELKQESQQRNLFFLGSDVKTEITNVIDVFSTNFIDLTYYQLLSFLRFSRPLLERIADQLISLEEIDGNTLRTLMKEFFFNFEEKNKNIVLDSRNSTLFEILFPEIMKSPLDIEQKANRLLLEIRNKRIN